MPLVRLLDRRPRGTLGLAAAVPRHRQPRDHRRVDSTLLPADTGSHACAAGAHTRASTKAGVGPLFMTDLLLATSAAGCATCRITGPAGCARRAQQDPWSRRRDARARTNAGLPEPLSRRRVVAPPHLEQPLPSRECSTREVHVVGAALTESASATSSALVATSSVAPSAVIGQGGTTRTSRSLRAGRRIGRVRLLQANVFRRLRGAGTRAVSASRDQRVRLNVFVVRIDRVWLCANAGHGSS